MIANSLKNSQQQIVTLSIAIPRPLPQLFHYLPTTTLDIQTLKPGIRIRIPFGRHNLVGIFIGIAHHSPVELKKLREIIEVIDEVPVFDTDMQSWLEWVSTYYHYPIGDVYNIAMPALLRKGHPMTMPTNMISTKTEKGELPFKLTEEQTYAVNTISEKKRFNVFLIDGVTGSGKTEIYFHIITKHLKQHHQILVLVPEIGLTPQIMQRFEQRFLEPIAMIHSNLSDKKRLDNWMLAKENKASIVIGTRSAIFTPMPKLGLIIIDEEHDASFKQQDTLRYSARDIAIMLAKQRNIPIVLGSATPSLESYYNVQQNRYHYIRLTQRAANAHLPEIKLVDIRNQHLDDGLSNVALQAIHYHLTQKNQILIFLNRRGFAPNLICHQCGYVFTCLRCDTAYTYHQEKNKLICHHCNQQLATPTKCSNCKGGYLFPLGLGTERIEAVLKKHFPQESVVRIDRDTTRKKGSFETLMQKIHNKDYNILIGTQMLAKGHHFPNITLAIVVNADGGLLSNDLRSAERMGQLIMQVAGRSGRAEKPGEVLIQTRQPDNPYLICLLKKNYPLFAKLLLEQRQQAQLPPFTFLALFRAESSSDIPIFKFLEAVKVHVLKTNRSTIHCFGPVFAPHPKKAGKIRAQLLIQASDRKELQTLLTKLIPTVIAIKVTPKVQWSLDVDPLDLL